MISTKPIRRTNTNYWLGNTHIHLSKYASDAETVHALAGTLYLSKSGWLLLSVPNALVRGAFDAMNEQGVELPPSGPSDKLNAHISVMRPEEIETFGGPDKITERGHNFHYTLGPVKTVSPKTWTEMSKVWFIEVKSKELQDLRKSYGLTPLPNDNKFQFHITLAVRRKHVLRANEVKKAASARSAVIIKGNPMFRSHPNEREDFYNSLASHLKNHNFDTTFDNGDPYTVPSPADLWIGHSRGADRLKYAPKETLTFNTEQYEHHRAKTHAIEQRELAKALGFKSLSEVPRNLRTEPPVEHYHFTPEMQEALDKLIQSKYKPKPKPENSHNYDWIAPAALGVGLAGLGAGAYLSTKQGTADVKTPTSETWSTSTTTPTIQRPLLLSVFKEASSQTAEGSREEETGSGEEEIGSGEASNANSTSLDAIIRFYDTTDKFRTKLAEDTKKKLQNAASYAFPLAATGLGGLALHSATNTRPPAQVTKFPTYSEPSVIRGRLSHSAPASQIDGTNDAYLAFGGPRTHGDPKDIPDLYEKIKSKLSPDQKLKILELQGHGEFGRQIIDSGYETSSPSINPKNVDQTADLLKQLPWSKNDPAVVSMGCNTGLCKPDELKPNNDWLKRLADKTGIKTMGARGYTLLTPPDDALNTHRIAAGVKFPDGTTLDQIEKGKHNDPSEDNSMSVYNPDKPMEKHTENINKQTYTSMPNSRLYELLYNIGKPAALLGGAAVPFLKDKKTARNVALGATAASAPMAMSEILTRIGEARGKGNDISAHMSSQAKALPYLALAGLPLASYGLSKAFGRWRKKDEPRHRGHR